jgi:hypothetical protein
MSAMRKLIGFSGIIIPIAAIFVFIIAINPLYENFVCNENACLITTNYLFNNINKEISKSKHSFSIVSQKDMLNVNQYIICIDEHLYGNNCPLFQTSYFSKINSERDLSLLSNNKNVNIVKKNVALIQICCIYLYAVLLIIGIIIKRK